MKAKIEITFDKVGNKIENLNMQMEGVNLFEVVGIFELMQRHEVVKFLQQFST